MKWLKINLKLKEMVVITEEEEEEKEVEEVEEVEDSITKEETEWIDLELVELMLMVTELIPEVEVDKDKVNSEENLEKMLIHSTENLVQEEEEDQLIRKKVLVNSTLGINKITERKVKQQMKVKNNQQLMARKKLKIQ